MLTTTTFSVVSVLGTAKLVLLDRVPDSDSPGSVTVAIVRIVSLLGIIMKMTYLPKNLVIGLSLISMCGCQVSLSNHRHQQTPSHSVTEQVNQAKQSLARGETSETFQQSTVNPSESQQGTAANLISTGDLTSFQASESSHVVPVSNETVDQPPSFVVDAREHVPELPVGVPIDLPTALHLAGADNWNIRLAQEQINEACAQYDFAKSMWLPSINLGNRLQPS